MKISYGLLILLAAMLSFTNQTLAATGPKKVKYYEGSQFVKKSKQMPTNADRIRVQVPVAIPEPPPPPSAQGSDLSQFDYYMIVHDGHVRKVTDRDLHILANGGWVNADGSVSTIGQQKGLLAVPHSQTNPATPNQAAYNVPVPVVQKTPELPLPQVKVPHHLQDAATPLPAGASAIYYAQLPDGHVVQITDSNNARLQQSGLIRADGSIAQRGIDSGLTRVVVPPSPHQSVPAPNKQRPNSTNTAHNNKAPAHSPQQTAATPHLAQDYTTPLPPGATANYYMRLPDGSLRQITDSNKARLLQSGTIHADGSIAQRGIDAGLTRVVVPSQSNQAKPITVKDKQTAELNYQLQSTPESHIVYYAPKQVELEEHEREVLSPDEVIELSQKGHLHPDGSLTASALNEGYTSTALVNEEPELIQADADIHAFVDSANKDHLEILKNKVAPILEPKFDSENLAESNSAGLGGRGFNWLWLLLLLIPIGAYIYNKKGKSA